MWERGYFYITVGKVEQETIKAYIEDQGKQKTNTDSKISKGKRIVALADPCTIRKSLVQHCINLRVICNAVLEPGTCF